MTGPFFNILALVLFTVSLNLSAWAVPTNDWPRCFELLSDYAFMASDETIEISENSFVYHDLGYDFHFLAEVRERTLALDVLLVDPDRKIRSHYSGSNLYQKAMEHFGPLNIDVIEGLWQSGDNYEAFLENVARGLSPEEAALHTWSGQQARLFGFSEVRKLDWNKLSKRPEKIVVEFVRPTTPPRVVSGKIRRQHNQNTFHIRDPEHEFEFYAHLNSGRLFLNVSLVDYQNNKRSSLKGSDLYVQMMKKFGPQNINVIEGIWSEGTNHQMYFSNLARGLTPEEAAAQTWSGRQAARFGFTDIEVVHHEWSVVQGRTLVTVEFRKP